MSSVLLTTDESDIEQISQVLRQTVSGILTTLSYFFMPKSKSNCDWETTGGEGMKTNESTLIKAYTKRIRGALRELELARIILEKEFPDFIIERPRLDEVELVSIIKEIQDFLYDSANALKEATE